MIRWYEKRRGSMEQQKLDNLKLGEKGAYLSIVAYLFLSVLKLFVGFTSNAEVLKADGLNNLTDIIASIAVLIGLKYAQKPADGDHRYGHWKSETIASLIASFIMAFVGIEVILGAVKSLFEGRTAAPDLISMWVGIFSAIVMFFVYKYNKNLGENINSSAVKAAAKDNLSDALVSIGAVVGIIASQFEFYWIDTVAAFIVGLIICKTAWDIFYESVVHLTDGFDEDLLEKYEGDILNIAGVHCVKSIKARNYGNTCIIDVVIGIKGSLEVVFAHDITDEIEEMLKKKYEVLDVFVHVEPV